MARKFPLYMEKDGDVRTAYSEGDVVRFQFDGFSVKKEEPASTEGAAKTDTSKSTTKTAK